MNKYTSISVSVGFDGKPDAEMALKAYVFSRAGTLLATAPVTKGTATLKGDVARTGLRLFIAPERAAGEGELTPTLAGLIRSSAYQPALPPDLSKPVVLKPIPQRIWPNWLRACRVCGQVVNPTTVGGTLSDLPLPYARVHSCEVEPAWFRFRVVPKP